MIVGVRKVICTCETEMRRTGGVFGGDSPPQDTYYCSQCQKHIIVITPNQEAQEEFTKEINGRS